MDIVRTGWGENESIYVLDARQVYFLKKVGEQLDSGTLQALKEEKEAIKYLTNFEDRQNYLEEEYQYQGITPPKLDNFEAYSYKDQLSYLRKGHFAMNNEIRREIKRMVKKQEPLPSFDLDYGGLAITDLEARSLSKLSGRVLITFLDNALTPAVWGPSLFNDVAYIRMADEVLKPAMDPMKLSDVKNWKGCMTGRDLEIDDLDQCDTNFWKHYPQLRVSYDFLFNHPDPDLKTVDLDRCEPEPNVDFDTMFGSAAHKSSN